MCAIDSARRLPRVAIGVSVALALLMWAPVRADIMSPDDELYGKTIGEWGEQWWNWAVLEPSETNPLLDETGEDGDLNQSGPVWFLAGNFGGTTVRTFPLEVPVGKTLFFPILTYGAWVPEDGDNEEELRATANASMDAAAVLALDIDGMGALGSSVRAESPAGGFMLQVPEGSLLTEEDFGGKEAGEYLAVADGYWAVIDPLPLGNHVIHFAGVIGDPDAPDFVLDVTYLPLDVVPEPSSLLLLSMGAVGLLAYAWRRKQKAN